MTSQMTNIYLTRPLHHLKQTPFRLGINIAPRILGYSDTEPDPSPGELVAPRLSNTTFNYQYRRISLN